MTAVAPARRYVVPAVPGDPAAARRMAAAYRGVADAVAANAQLISIVVRDLSTGWSGPGSRALDAPVGKVLHDAAALVRVLHEVADRLEEYAGRLERARQHHGFSLGKLVAIGAIVTVGAAAIVVTVGAAGAVEAAAASAAVADATEAAGAAAAASAGVAGGLFDVADALATFRPLLQFVVPHLLQVEWSVGTVAAYDEATRGRLDWGTLAVTGGLAFTGSVATGRVAAAMADAPAVATHAAEATVWSGVAAADDEVREGQVDGVDMLETFVLAGGALSAKDALASRGILFHPPDYRRAALVAELRRPGRIADAEVAREMALLRQPVHDLLGGNVELALQEGPGHTLRRHVSRSTSQLTARLRQDGIPRASTFWSEADARSAIDTAITGNAAEVRAWLAAGRQGRLRLRVQLPYDVGMVAHRSGRIVLTRTACVVLARDAAGVYVLTGFPEVGRCR